MFWGVLKSDIIHGQMSYCKMSLEIVHGPSAIFSTYLYLSNIQNDTCEKLGKGSQKLFQGGLSRPNTPEMLLRFLQSAEIHQAFASAVGRRVRIA